MIKLIFKRIWTQRKSNGWLILNITIISLLMITLVDSLFQIKMVYSAPSGFTYDKENTYVANCVRLHSEEEISTEDVADSFNSIFDKIKRDPSVENVSILYETYNGDMINYDEKLAIRNFAGCIFADRDFFEIFKPKLLSDIDIYSDNFNNSWNYDQEITPVVISTDVADQNFFIESIVDGRPKFSKNNDYKGLTGSIYEVKKDDGEVKKYRIMAVMESTAFSNPLYSRNSVYAPFQDRDKIIANNTSITIIFKTKRGAGLKGLPLDKFDINIHKVSSIKSYDEFVDDNAKEDGTLGIVFNFGLVAMFFILNLIIAVFGSFWYRIVKRKSEIGVQMAVGASPISIFRELSIEALLILTVGYIPAFIIAANQFYFGIMPVNMRREVFTVDIFMTAASWTYLVMSVLIFIGIFFPALKAMRVKPAVALNSDK